MNFICWMQETAYKVEKDKSLTKLAEGMEGGTDGIENVTGNDFIVSCWAGCDLVRQC